MQFQPTRRRALAVLALAAVAVGAVVTVAAPSAGASPTPAVAGSALITGTVTDGSTAVSGASVTLEAWPNGATLAAQPEGADVPTRVVATATTGSTGSYSLSPDLAGLDSSYLEPDGSVALQLTTVTTTTQQTYNLSGAAAGTTAATSGDVAVPGLHPDTVSFDAGRLTVTDSAQSANVTNDEATVKAPTTISSGTTFASVGVSPDDNTDPVTCGGWSSGSIQYGRPEHFMTLYSWSGGKGEVDESTSSSHSLGVAVSVNGGAFHASGSITKTTSISGGVNQLYGSNYVLYNRVNYRSYTQHCSGGNANYYNHKIQAISFNALQDDGLRAATSEVFWNYANGCQTFSSGTAYKSRGSNIEYQWGVALAVPNGSLGVEAKASFSTNTSITWHITSKTKVCGDSSSGWLNAPLAAARNYYDVQCTPGKPC